MNLQILGSINDLEKIVLEHRPDVVVVALSERRGVFPYREILDCKLRGTRVEDWPTFYEKLTGKILIQNLRPSWLIFSEGFTRTGFIKTMKRTVDILCSVLGLCVSLPLMVCISLLIKLDSRGAVFFRQERVGEHGKVFTLYKFRTMIADAENQRLTVKPGVTGWAQVRYGYGATVEDALEKLQYDLYYIKNMSFFLDFLIVLSTLHKVLFAKVAVQTESEAPLTRLEELTETVPGIAQGARILLRPDARTAGADHAVLSRANFSAERA